MSTKAVARVQTIDRTINQLQSNVKAAVDPLLSIPLNSGNLLTSISLVVGKNTINHGLNQVLTGWFVTRLRDTYAKIHDSQTTNPLPASTLILESDTAVTVDLYVF